MWGFKVYGLRVWAEGSGVEGLGLGVGCWFGDLVQASGLSVEGLGLPSPKP